jgi:hypothetical protein
MKPSPAQRFLAKDWPWRVAFWGSSVALATVFAVRLHFSAMHLVPAVLVGAMAGFAVTYFILYLAWHLRARLNGAPFQIGDSVQILTRRHYGIVTTVYEEWRERHQIRVELGEEAKKSVEDVFSLIEVARAKNI